MLCLVTCKIVSVEANGHAPNCRCAHTHRHTHVYTHITIPYPGLFPTPWSHQDEEPHLIPSRPFLCFYGCMFAGHFFKVSYLQQARHSSRPYKVPGTALGPGSSTMNKADSPALEGRFSQGRRTVSSHASQNVNRAKCGETASRSGANLGADAAPPGQVTRSLSSPG